MMREKMIREKYWEEACEIFSLTKEERELAYKLLDGPMELSGGLAERFGMQKEAEKGTILPPIFGHTEREIFLYPVFVSFVSGRIPNPEDGSLPRGVFLEFSEAEKMYCAEALADELAGIFTRDFESDREGICCVLAGKEGSHFIAGQTAYKAAMPLLVWDGSAASQTELLLTAALYQAIICLDLRKAKEAVREESERAAGLCRLGLDIFVLAESAEQAKEISGKVDCVFRKVPMPNEAQRLLCVEDYLDKNSPFLSAEQCKKLTREEVSISVLLRILRELWLEFRISSEKAGTASPAVRLPKTLSEAVYERVVSRYRPKSTALIGIKRLAANKRLEDLWLPMEHHKKLTMICKMLKNREKVMEQWGFANKFSYGNGISILLYGAPGTGKTMAAQVIAAELGKALYRVDLSGVISKYIGETQKNIAKIFDQTKQLNGILLFDEADALFARRNEVSDAQDKYSNAETAYLLQKIEESDGICILTTNLLQNFDEAFRRRITYMINFPMPDAALRKKIWENVFPKEAPVSEEVNFGLLAESFELSGAAIRNAALQSAWLSSVEEDCITMQGILGSVANEYRKLNKALKPEQKALMERFDALMF